MKKLITLVLLASSTLWLAGCGSDDVSMATAEEQRTVARDNSKLVANKFRQENPQYRDYSVIPNGDSTITRQCPQGDGWASLKLHKDGKKPVKIKCSTYSIGIGCLTATEFAGKPFASQDGTCNKDVAYPLPKIAN